MSGLFSLFESTHVMPDPEQLNRMEAKLNLILDHLGLEFIDPSTSAGLSDEVRARAEQPRKRIDAIKLHRVQTGVGLKGAKQAVDAYLVQRR